MCNNDTRSKIISFNFKHSSLQLQGLFYGYNFILKLKHRCIFDDM